MKPTTRGRISLRDQIARNQSALDALRPHGAPRVVLDMPSEPKQRAPRVATGKVEADVQAEVIAYLNERPDCRAVTRTNSGVMKEGERYIRMATVYGKQNGMRMRLSDVQCVLTPLGRKVVIECKHPLWKRPSNPREHEQAAYLECVREAGGIGIFATCLQDVINALPEL